ncbi:MAG: hypothetical protein WAW80_00590 [Candidatus Saccharimonadales bacterium]
MEYKEMTIPKSVNDEMKQIMVRTVIRTLLTALVVVETIVIAMKYFGFTPSAQPFVIVLLIVGSLMAVIGNNFVMHATTRLNARETILWKWGNNVQASGFVITLIAAFL